VADLLDTAFGLGAFGLAEAGPCALLALGILLSRFLKSLYIDLTNFSEPSTSSFPADKLIFNFVLIELSIYRFGFLMNLTVSLEGLRTFDICQRAANYFFECIFESC